MCGGRTFFSRFNSELLATEHLLVPFVSAVVNLRDGAIHSIVWDNLCANCGSSECATSQAALDDKMVPSGAYRESSGTCGVTATELAGKERATDFKVFLTWAGTDVDGRPAKSSAFRFSKFAGATLRDMWSNTKDSYNDAWG